MGWECESWMKDRGGDWDEWVREGGECLTHSFPALPHSIFLSKITTKQTTLLI